MKNPARKEPKKPRTAADKGKRYRCCVCRKKSPQKTRQVPYTCPTCARQKEADNA